MKDCSDLYDNIFEPQLREDERSCVVYLPLRDQNFRKNVSDASVDTISRIKAAAVEIENDAMIMQKPIEGAARRLYARDKTAAMKILTNYSNGIYLSSIEAMQKVLSEK